MTSRHSAFALRPGSKFRAFDAKWVILRNNTLERTLELRQVGGTLTKRIRYQPTTEITCYWVPFDHR